MLVLRREIRADNETRTRDHSLGKARIMLYQLGVVINMFIYWIWVLRRERLERETRLELATPTLARSCSTN